MTLPNICAGIIFANMFLCIDWDFTYSQEIEFTFPS